MSRIWHHVFFFLYTTFLQATLISLGVRGKKRGSLCVGFENTRCSQIMKWGPLWIGGSMSLGLGRMAFDGWCVASNLTRHRKRATWEWGATDWNHSHDFSNGWISHLFRFPDFAHISIFIIVWHTWAISLSPYEERVAKYILLTQMYTKVNTQEGGKMKRSHKKITHVHTQELFDAQKRNGREH